MGKSISAGPSTTETCVEIACLCSQYGLDTDCEINIRTDSSTLAHTIDDRNDLQRDVTLALGSIPLTKLKIVRFNNDDHVSTHLAWWPRNNDWIWGYEVDELIARNEIMECDKFDMIKLSIERSEWTKALRERLERQFWNLPPLARKRLAQNGAPKASWAELLITMYLKLLWDSAKDRVIRHYGHSQGNNIFDNREIECWIGVPKPVTPLHASTIANDLLGCGPRRSII